jgi:hypothetical protein
VLLGPVVDFEPEAPEVLGFASLVAAVVGADEVAVEPSFAGLDVDAATTTTSGTCSGRTRSTSSP